MTGHALLVEQVLHDGLRLRVGILREVERPGELHAIGDRLDELLRLRLLCDGRVLAEARGADAGALLVAADAATVLAGHALDPEALAADGHAPLVDGLEVDRDERRDVGEPEPAEVPSILQ